MKKTMGILLLALVAAFSVAGCGGSGGSGGSGGGDVVYSSDYFGCEVGVQWTYSCSGNDNGSTINTIWKINVMSVTQKSDASIYKVAEAYDGETLGSAGSGEYAEKQGASYYYYGTWDGSTDDLESTPSLTITNPVTSSFNSTEWGTNQGQVTVTVPAGTFTAWHFSITWSDSIYTYTDQRWFVPYLGMVKLTRTEVRRSDSVTTFTITKQLASTAKGVTISSTTTPQVKAQSTAKHKGLLGK